MTPALTLTAVLAAPVTHLPGSNAGCTSDEPDHAVEFVLLPGGGEVETVTTPSSTRINFYLDGKRVLTVSEKNGRVDAIPTEHGLALDPERAAEFRDEVVSRAQTITESHCTGRWPARPTRARSASSSASVRGRWVR